jgi:hypothetical protein
MQTLREAFKDDVSTKTLRLISTRGIFIAQLPIEEALERYGDWFYHNAYSDSFTKVSVWILKPSKNK